MLMFRMCTSTARGVSAGDSVRAPSVCHTRCLWRLVYVTHDVGAMLTPSVCRSRSAERRPPIIGWRSAPSIGWCSAGYASAPLAAAAYASAPLAAGAASGGTDARRAVLSGAQQSVGGAVLKFRVSSTSTARGVSARFVRIPCVIRTRR